MTTPWKHPKTGVFYLRVRSPADVVERIAGQKLLFHIAGADHTVTAGKAGVVQVSLGTKDIATAKQHFAEAYAQIQKAWEAHRNGPERLSPKRTVALAGELYREMVATFDEEQLFHWQVWAARAVAAVSARMDGRYGPMADLMIPVGPNGDKTAALEATMGAHADRLLLKKGELIDAESRGRLLGEISKAYSQAANVIARKADGDYSPDEDARRFPSWEAQAAPVAELAVTFESLFDDYLRQPGKLGKRRRRTEETYRTIFLTEFRGFISAQCKHSDPLMVVKADMVAWRDSLQTQGLSPKTIRDKKVAAVKAVYSRAHRDGKITANPAEGLDVVVPRKSQVRERGFTDSEALALLAAATKFIKGRHSDNTVNAIKWTPWLGAYTGARISELTQLRGEDVFEGKEGWMLRITPKAGSVKSGQYRDVPVHSHLIELGFIDFARKRGPGHLFIKAGADAASTSSRAETMGGTVSDWARTIVSDPEVAPTHGWRHRFKTKAREHGIGDEARDYIPGHAIPGMSGRYGDMAGLHREIEKLPRLVIES